MKDKYIYLVEGECERKLVKVLQSDELIRYGKIIVFNPVNEKMTIDRLRTINKDSNIVFVFDTDTNNYNILNQNIYFVKKLKYINILVPQIHNLEDELVYSTAINNIKELLNVSSVREHKTRFINEKNLMFKLKKADFNINKLWSRDLDYPKIINDSWKVKLLSANK